MSEISYRNRDGSGNTACVNRHRSSAAVKSHIRQVDIGQDKYYEKQEQHAQQGYCNRRLNRPTAHT